MDLSTTYLGLRLPHPFMPGASPMVDDLDMVKRLEDAGAAAIVMHSLFEEQITAEQLATISNIEMHEESFAEALSYFPRLDQYALGPEQYLERIRHIKEAVAVPVIASLNGVTPAGWLEYASLIQQAGADAVELNVYFLATAAHDTAESVEGRLLEIVRTVKAAVTIPVAVKLSPFFSALTHLAQQLDDLGADGLVIFNRFYQPDIDLEQLEVVPRLELSHSYELLLRLNWVAIVYGHVRADLAITGGVHTAEDVLKSMMVGARVAMMTSALLEKGVGHIRHVLHDLRHWMEEHEYESVRQMQGSMARKSVSDPAAFERANYMRVLSSYAMKKVAH